MCRNGGSRTGQNCLLVAVSLTKVFVDHIARKIERLNQTADALPMSLEKAVRN